MEHTRSIARCFRFILGAAIAWFAAVTQTLAAGAPAKPDEGGMTDYMLSYMLVALGIVLGMLVVAKTANRRDRERPSGYVEKNIMAEK